jgi:hypothetical protein
MLPFDAIHWWQQPAELDGNRLLRDYTDRNSLGTMPANIPGASPAFERSVLMDDCREVSAASRLGFVLSRLRIGLFSSGSNSGF